MTPDSFATDAADDELDDCFQCRGKRLLEQWPDHKYMKCFHCTYKEQVKQSVEKKI